MNVQEELLRTAIDPSLTVDNLSQISQKAFGSSVRANGYDVLTGGCWNRVISVRHDSRDDLVFKISPEIGNSGLEREFHVLRYFSEHTSLPVPEPLHFDLSGNIVRGSLLVMRKIPGHVMHQVYGYLDTEARNNITTQIARYVSELHHSKATRFGGIEKTDLERLESWSDFWIPRFDRAMEQVRSGNYIATNKIDEIDVIRPSFRSLLDIGPDSTATHYDIWSGNVMIDMEVSPPRVSGFIDIPGFFADYAREISFMLMFGLADRAFFDVYTANHHLDPEFWIRVHIYNLKMHLKHITMYPTESYYRQGADECLSVIKKQLGKN